MKTYRAFTARAKGIQRDLRSTCEVCAATSPEVMNSPARPKMLQVNAIWDTGATGSCITQNVVDALHLIPVGKRKISTANGENIADVYNINIGLPNGVGFTYIQVTCTPIGGADMLIGMDMIMEGDLCITNKNGDSKFTFQIPSSHDTDYVEEINLMNKYRKIHQAWIAHGNHKCPCGSGKNWDKCHGKDEEC